MIETWVEEYIDSVVKYTGSGREIHVNCPFCNDTRYRLFINTSTGAFYCHNCQSSGSFVTLIQQVEGTTYTRAFQKYTEYSGNTSIPQDIGSVLTKSLIARNDLELSKRSVPLPDEYVKADFSSNNQIMHRALRYLRSRHISRDQIMSHSMGVCYRGNYQNRIIIPITEGNELRFWVARAIGTDVKLKEKSPSSEDYQWSKSEVVFNIDRAASACRSAVLCEGIFDALSFGVMGVSLLGKSLYQAQFDILMDYRGLLSDGVYIALDWDAQDQAIDIARQLSDYFDVYIVNVPKELDDPNNALQQRGRAYMAHLLAESEPYGELSSVYHLLQRKR